MSRVSTAWRLLQACLHKTLHVRVGCRDPTASSAPESRRKHFASTGIGRSPAPKRQAKFGTRLLQTGADSALRLIVPLDGMEAHRKGGPADAHTRRQTRANVRTDANRHTAGDRGTSHSGEKQCHIQSHSITFGHIREKYVFLVVQNT